MLQQDKIKLLDEAFSDYLKNGDSRAFCKKTSQVLSAFARDKSFTVSIMQTKPTSKEPFVGMRVFPEMQYMDALLKEIVESDGLKISEACDRWRSIPKWEIEIDSAVFDRNVINFNPQELTAMMLHEVAHVIYSDKPFERFYRVYMEYRLRMKTSERAAAQIMYTLYMIPLTVAIGIRDWGVDSAVLREELFADASVAKLGYGEHLISAFEKIIRTFGDGGYQPKNYKDKIVANSMVQCNLNIKDLRHRREKLKDELYQSGAMHNSNIIRSIVSNVMSKMGVMKKTKYDGATAMEAVTNVEYEDAEFLQTTDLVIDTLTFNALENQIRLAQNSATAAMESIFRGRKPKVPSQLDVDTIFVEVDRISNHADRRYVLDLIYHQEEKIERFMEYCESHPSEKKKYWGKMESMLKELQEMRDAVLAKRSFQKDYKVFVRYPAGYEG